MGLKKLYSDMSEMEVKLLKEVIDKNKICRISYHTYERMTEKNISKDDINFVFNNYEIIEFHYNEDARVLLRGKTKDDNGRCTCISISLKDRIIITAYKNYNDDIHKTLDYSNYIMKNINITNILKNIKKNLKN